MSHRPYDVSVVNAAAGSAADDASGTGFFQLVPSVALKGKGIPVFSITGWKNEAYAAGTAHVVEEDWSGVSLAADKEYYVRIRFASNPTVAYTFAVAYTAAPASSNTIVDDLVEKINAASDLGLTASRNTTSLRIAVDAVADGEILVDDSEGGTYADAVAYVAPVGTVAEVEALSETANAGGEYIRISVYWNLVASVDGDDSKQYLKPVKSVVYIDGAGGLAANAGDLATALENHLNGITAATWAGAPSL